MTMIRFKIAQEALTISLIPVLGLLHLRGVMKGDSQLGGIRVQAEWISHSVVIS